MKKNTIFTTRSFVGLSVLLAMANINFVHANEPTVDTQGAQKQTRKLEHLTITASRIQALLSETPANVSVITRDELEQLNPNKLSDLLRYQPGVSVERSGDRQGDGSISIRGIGGNRILVVKDGIVMPDGFRSGGITQGRGNFDPFNLQQIEILKGPASALYGSNALGGVVVMNTLDPQLLVEQNNNQPYLSLNSGYFSEEERFRVGGTTAGKVFGGYGLFQAQHQTFNEIDRNSDFVVDPKDGKSDSFFTKWKHEGESQTFKVIGDYFKQDVSNIQLNPTSINTILSTTDDTSTAWRIGLQQEFFDLSFVDTFKWQVDYQYSNYKQFETEVTETTGVTSHHTTHSRPSTTSQPTAPSKELEHEWEDFKQKQLSLKLQAQKEYAFNHFFMGIDYIHNSVSRPIDTFKTDLIADSSTNEAVKVVPDVDITQYGIFLQDNMSLTDELTFVAGIRYDRFESDPQTDAAFEDNQTANTDIKSDTDNAVSPHLGVLYQLNEQTSLFANVTTGFRAPPASQMYINRMIPLSGGKSHEILPNNDLSSETSLGKELGIRWNNNIAKVELSVYRNDYDDFIDSKVVGYRVDPDTNLDIRQLQYQNVDKVEIKGAELSARLLLDQWLPSGWQGHANFAGNIIDGKDRSTDQGLNSISPNSAVIGLNIAPNNALEFDWHIRATAKADDAEPYVKHGRPQPAFEPAGYALQDISVRYRPIENLVLSFSVYNLMDKKYWPSSTKGDDASGDLSSTVAPGRNFGVTASYQF